MVYFKTIFHPFYIRFLSLEINLTLLWAQPSTNWKSFKVMKRPVVCWFWFSVKWGIDVSPGSLVFTEEAQLQTSIIETDNLSKSSHNPPPVLFCCHRQVWLWFHWGWGSNFTAVVDDFGSGCGIYLAKMLNILKIIKDIKSWKRFNFNMHIDTQVWKFESLMMREMMGMRGRDIWGGGDLET